MVKNEFFEICLISRCLQVVYQCDYRLISRYFRLVKFLKSIDDIAEPDHERSNFTNFVKFFIAIKICALKIIMVKNEFFEIL